LKNEGINRKVVGERLNRKYFLKKRQFRHFRVLSKQERKEWKLFFLEICEFAFSPKKKKTLISELYIVWGKFGFL
jgi:hypothetical protein